MDPLADSALPLVGRLDVLGVRLEFALIMLRKALFSKLKPDLLDCVVLPAGALNQRRLHRFATQPCEKTGLRVESPQGEVQSQGKADPCEVGDEKETGGG